MARNPFNHIDLRVSDMAAALPFYKEVMPALGFQYQGSMETAGVRWEWFQVRNAAPNQFFAITEDEDHLQNRNCIAFFAESRAEVNQIAEIAVEAGALNVEPPCLCPEYGKDYYAVFFEDPSGNRLEAVSWPLS